MFDLATGSLIELTPKGRDVVWLVKYQEVKEKRIVIEAMATVKVGMEYQPKILAREIIPGIITVFEYDVKGLATAVTYFSKKPLAELLAEVREGRHDTRAEVKRLLKKNVIHKISQSGDVIDISALPQYDLIKAIRKHFISKGYKLPYSDKAELKWVKIEYYKPNGDLRGYEYQLFAGSSQPIVKIAEPIEIAEGEVRHGIIDITFKYNGRELGLRFNPNEIKVSDKSFVPIVLSYTINPQEKLVVDLYKRLLFVEARNLVQGYLEKKIHLRKNGLFKHGWEEIVKREIGIIADYKK